MRVMVMVKATEDSEAGVLPSTEMIESMLNFNEELASAVSWSRATGLNLLQRASAWLSEDRIVRW